MCSERGTVATYDSGVVTKAHRAETHVQHPKSVLVANGCVIQTIVAAVMCELVCMSTIASRLEHASRSNRKNYTSVMAIVKVQCSVTEVL